MDYETVVLLRAGASEDIDIYNVPVPGEDDEISIDQCLFAPGRTSEPVEEGRTPVLDEADVYAPAGTVVLPTDRAMIRGDLWAVQGEPEDWSGGPGGVVFHVKRVTG